MKLHELTSIKSRRSQRVGRGGKRGHTAGRGTKGQYSRAGRRIRPAERDLIMRIPKRRGFRNKPKSDTVTVFNLRTISSKLKSFVKPGVPLEIDITLLKTAGLLSKNFTGEVKILGVGEAAFPITLKGIKASASVQAKMK